MTNREFYIHYSKDTKISGFQLSEGDVGGTRGLDQDDPESGCYHVISQPETFPKLTLEILKHLKKPSSMNRTYQTRLSESASNQMSHVEEKVLSEILSLHNDFVTPRRR